MPAITSPEPKACKAIIGSIVVEETPTNTEISTEDKTPGNGQEGGSPGVITKLVEQIKICDITN